MKHTKISTFLTMSLMCLLSWSVASAALVGSNTKNAISDSAITLTVKAKMAKEPAISSTAISVETNKGVVKLTGVTKNEAEAVKAVEIAGSIDGVRDVDASDLSVEGSNQPIMDAYITAKVNGKLMKEKILGDSSISARDITVNTTNGVVSLSGYVQNAQQIKNVISLTKSVKGVRNVESALKVKE